MYTAPGQDIDSLLESIVVLSGDRVKIEQEQISDVFWPTTGKWGMRGR
jgi:phenol 2-monooxygenase